MDHPAFVALDLAHQLHMTEAYRSVDEAGDSTLGHVHTCLGSHVPERLHGELEAHLLLHEQAMKKL